MLMVVVCRCAVAMVMVIVAVRCVAWVAMMGMAMAHVIVG